MTSPTARTLAELRRLGYLAEVVERWIAPAKIRKDLFGIGDVLALRPAERPLLIQACAGSSHAARAAKIRAADHYVLWMVLRRMDVEVWSWSKRGPRGARKLWTLRREEITAASAAPTALPPADHQPLSASPRRPRRRTITEREAR